MVVETATLSDGRIRRLVASRIGSNRILSQSRSPTWTRPAGSTARSCTHVERRLPNMRRCLIVLLLLLQGCRQLVSAEVLQYAADDVISDIYRKVIKNILENHIKGSLASDHRKTFDLDGLEYEGDRQLTADTRRGDVALLAVRELVRDAGQCLYTCRDSGHALDTCKRRCVPDTMLSVLRQLKYVSPLSAGENVSSSQLLRRRQSKRGVMACMQRCSQKIGLGGHRCKAMCH